MSAEESILFKKSKNFSFRMLKMARFIPPSRSTNVLVSQVLRSGTSIGANIAEAQYAQSLSDFISKISISLKEASETLYWLELLYKNGDLTQEQYQSMIKDCDELRIMMISSIKTAKSNASKFVRDPEMEYVYNSNDEISVNLLKESDIFDPDIDS